MIQEMVAAVNRKEPFQFDHRVIANAVEPDPAMNPDTDRSSLNRNIKFNEIHDVFLDRTISPCRIADEPVGTAFRLVSWSPTGLLPNKKSILAAATADHRVILYKNGRYNWEVLGCPSTCWINHLRQNDWAEEPLLPTVPESDHSTIFTIHKSRAYLLGTVALAWSPLYTSGPIDATGKGSWAWFVTLQRSGHVVLWKVSSPNGQLQLVGSYDLQLADPSAIQLALGSHSSSCLLVAGSHRGIVKCWAFNWIAEDLEKSNSMPELSFMSAIYPDEDGIAVGAIRIYSIGRFRIVATAKNSALVTVSILLDGNGLRVVQSRYALMPGLKLSGWMDMAKNRILCISEDYLLNEVDLTVDDQGIFTIEDQLPIVPVFLPSSPAMLSRGIAGSPDGNNKTLFVLESIKVPFDHLKCREPTSLAVYLAGDLQRVVEDLKKAETMKESLLTLESYKALYGPSWESIWELESDDPTTESIHNLQLLRWLALFKAHVCYLERRHDKDLHDDLKAHAERAEVMLQLRHIQKTFASLLEKPIPSNEEEDCLSPEEQLVVRLSCDLILSLQLADRGLSDQVRDRFRMDQSSSGPVDELCSICTQVIPFEKREDGVCPSGHKAIRCRATLRTCFDITRSCGWCGTHYHPYSGIEECILCGGPAF